jgi:hypothetical protein
MINPGTSSREIEKNFHHSTQKFPFRKHILPNNTNQSAGKVVKSWKKEAISREKVEKAQERLSI